LDEQRFFLNIQYPTRNIQYPSKKTSQISIVPCFAEFFLFFLLFTSSVGYSVLDIGYSVLAQRHIFAKTLF